MINHGITEMISTGTAALINFWIIAVLCMIASVATTTANTLAIIALVKLRLYRKVSKFLLLLLSIVDLMMGLITDVLAAARYIALTMGKKELSLQILLVGRASGFYFSAMSAFTITVACYEMYLSILKPLLPPRRAKRILIYHLVFWVFWILLVSLININEQAWQIFAGLICVVIVFFYVALCILLFRILRETNRIAADGNAHTETKDKVMKRKMLKITYQILMVNGISLAPYIFLVISKNIWTEEHLFIDTFLRPWAFSCILLASLLNPFIHVFRLKRVRRCLKDIFKLVSL